MDAKVKKNHLPYVWTFQIQLDEKIIVQVYVSAVDWVGDTKMRCVRCGPSVGVAHLLELCPCWDCWVRWKIPQATIAAVVNVDCNIYALYVRAFALGTGGIGRFTQHCTLHNEYKYDYAY